VTASSATVVVAVSEPLLLDALARVVRQSARVRLEGEVSTTDELVRVLRERRPAVAVVESDALGMDGARLLQIVESASEAARVLFVGRWPSEQALYDLVAAGAAGWLTRHASPDEVLRAISSVARGSTYLAADVQDAVAGEIKLRAREPVPRLTDREQEILERVAAGESAPSIGRAMHLSAATVKTHLGHLYQKLDVSERAAAVAVAMRRGLLD